MTAADRPDAGPARVLGRTVGRIAGRTVGLGLRAAARLVLAVTR